ncbi:MAG TPA: mandelate racemase/muconate lactonizing enzyme family protein [Terrimicrobiaceae bacterium]
MKVRGLKAIHCDAGWRPWTFLKVETDSGIDGWSECSESNGSPRGIAAVLAEFEPLLIGSDPREVERIYWLLYSRTRQSAGGVVQKAIAAVENALLDIKAKSLGVPVSDLFGGKLRDRLPVYWSHCGTTRVRAAPLVGKPAVRRHEDLDPLCEEILKSGCSVIKTNICLPANDGGLFVYMPGFAKTAGGPELNTSPEISKNLRAWVDAFGERLGGKARVALDLNYNFRAPALLELAHELKGAGLAWLEVDTEPVGALRSLRGVADAPIASGENLMSARAYLDLLSGEGVDIASIDVLWNGFLQSKKAADAAQLFGVPVSPHNFNGHLGTAISAHFAAMVPNLFFFEYDFDDVPWRDELFGFEPQIAGGAFAVPTAPGWGVEVNEEVARKHPWPRP